MPEFVTILEAEFAIIIRSMLKPRTGFLVKTPKPNLLNK